jgi:hypothetical protein
MLVLVLSATLVLITKQTAHADYQGGRLIDDNIFLNARAMSSVQGVQNFLVARGGGLANRSFLLNCYAGDSPERQWYTAVGAPCDQTVPASTIIYFAAQVYGINPQVILATLQKEQGLITAQNPTDWQLNQAMGYGCPTSGGCGSSTFFYQVDNGTWALRFHFERARGNNNWWRPTTSWTCGTSKKYYKPNLYPGQNVSFYDEADRLYRTYFIDNAATSSMYCYTPHTYNNFIGCIPSWGVSYDSSKPTVGNVGNCYSGSYNFVVSFERWFGPTNGLLIRTNEDGRVYVMGNNNTYYYIVDSNQLRALGYGLNSLNIVFVGRSFLNGMTFAGDLPNNIRFGNSQDVYALSGGSIHYFSYDNYLAYGQPVIGNLSIGLKPYFQTGTNIEKVLRLADGEEIYNVDLGKKRHIGGPTIFNANFSTLPSVSLTRYYANSLADGPPILQGGTITRTSDTNQFGITNSSSSSQRNIDSNTAQTLFLPTYTAPSVTINQITRTNPPLTNLIKDSSNNLFIVDGAAKIHLSLNQFNSMGYSVDEFVLAPQDFLSKFSTMYVSGSNLLIRSRGDSAVYEVRDKQLWRIPTLAEFNHLGYSFNNVLELNSSTIDRLFINEGSVLLASGSLFRINNQPTVFIVDHNLKSRRIETGYIFGHFRFNYSNVINVSSFAASKYPVDGILRQIVKDPASDSYWLIDNGTRRWVPNEMALNNFGVQQLNLVTTNSRVLNILSIGQNMTVYIRPVDSINVFKIESGKKRLLSLNDFISLNSSWNEVIPVSQSLADSIPNI